MGSPAMKGGPMGSRWALTLTVAAAIVLGSASAATATGPVSLDENQFLDASDVLSASQEQTVQDRLVALSDETDVDLWVVYVDDFTNPTSSEEWANATALANGLGTNQYLLAVSTEGRQFYLSGDSEGPVNGDALTAIEQQRIQPELAADDWAGAAVAAADGLEDAAGGGSGGVSDSSGGGGLLILLGVLVVAGIIVAIIMVRRRGKGTAGGGAQLPGQAPAEPLEQLEKRAKASLVQTDDAIKTSEQELGFARAQFGDAATAEFAGVLDAAKKGSTPRSRCSSSSMTPHRTPRHSSVSGARRSCS